MNREYVIAYKKYCDDIVLFTNGIQSIHKIFEDFNSIDENLKFTFEFNENYDLNFFDTHIYVDNETGEFEFEFFQKKIKNDKLDNFKFSVSPIKQKKEFSVMQHIDQIIFQAMKKIHEVLE